MSTKELRSNRGERTVLTYVKLDFLGDWEYYFNDYSFRPVGRSARLLVVTEAPTGNLVTHYFVVRRRPAPSPSGVQTTDHVIVPRESNIVFIPERCVQRRQGDHTRCAK